MENEKYTVERKTYKSARKVRFCSFTSFSRRANKKRKKHWREWSESKRKHNGVTTNDPGGEEAIK